MLLDLYTLYDLREVRLTERFYQDGITMWIMCFDLDVKKQKKLETCTLPETNIAPENGGFQ